MPDSTVDPKLPRPKLILHVTGASETELERGLAAAEAALYRDGDVDLVAAMAANAARGFIIFDDDWRPINVTGASWPPGIRHDGGPA